MGLKLSSTQRISSVAGDLASSNLLQNVRSLAGSIDRHRGSRVGMVVFSEYPDDPRPRRVISAFLDAGMKVDLVCIRAGRRARRESLPGLEIIRLRFKNRRGGRLSYVQQYFSFTLAASVVLAVRCLRVRYDLVYVHNMPDVLVSSALIPKLLGAKVILDIHDPMPELMTTIFKGHSSSRSVRVAKWLEKWSMARADLVLTVNESCRTIFASRSCPTDKIGVVMNSPDERIFPLRQPRPISANGRLSRPLVLMYHGSLLQRNGLDVAIDALPALLQKVPVELRVYGAATPFFERVMEDARRRGLNHAIRYFGLKSLEELVTAIDDCDLGIVPNHRNAFTEINTPTRIFEYLAMGKPVIAPATPGILDYFDADSLLLFEPGDSADLAAQIEQVACNYGHAVQVARRGQQIYLQHTWKRERETLLNLVTGLMPSGQA